MSHLCCILMNIEQRRHHPGVAGRSDGSILAETETRRGRTGRSSRPPRLKTWIGGGGGGPGVAGAGGAEREKERTFRTSPLACQQKPKSLYAQNAKWASPSGPRRRRRIKPERAVRILQAALKSRRTDTARIKRRQGRPKSFRLPTQPRARRRREPRDRGSTPKARNQTSPPALRPTGRPIAAHSIPQTAAAETVLPSSRDTPALRHGATGASSGGRLARANPAHQTPRSTHHLAPEQGQPPRISHLPNLGPAAANRETGQCAPKRENEQALPRCVQPIGLSRAFDRQAEAAAETGLPASTRYTGASFGLGSSWSPAADSRGGIGPGLYRSNTEMNMPSVLVRCGPISRPLSRRRPGRPSGGRPPNPSTASVVSARVTVHTA